MSRIRDSQENCEVCSWSSYGPCQSPQGLPVGSCNSNGEKEVMEQVLCFKCLIYIICFNPGNNPVKELQLFPSYYWGNCGSDKLSTQPKIKHKEVDLNSGRCHPNPYSFFSPLKLWEPWESLVTFLTVMTALQDDYHSYAVKGVLFLSLLQAAELNFSALLQNGET